ncbi:MAG: HAMP domain-containing protein [Myxococcales bacterium]|nr:HAMP domain-containing protein [Myxococcales bacterium]
MTTDKKTNGLGIFGKMLVIMLAAALLPTGLIWYVSYRVQSKQLESAIHTRLSATADRLSTYTDQWLDAHLRMLRLAALDPDIISMDGARQAPTLRAINQEYPYIYLAHTIRATDGTNEGRSDGKSSLYYGDRQYFKDALNPAKGYGLEAAVGKTSGLPAFILAVPIYRDGQAVGALSAALLIEDISKQIVDSSIGRTGFAFLLDAKGRVVAHPEKEFARVQKDLSQHAAIVAARSDQKPPFLLDDGGRRVVSVATTTREGMTLIAQQDVDEAYEPSRQANADAAFVLGGSAVVALLLAFAFSRGFTSPIRRLTHAAERMSLGEMSIAIPESTRTDELGDVARAIERMAVSLRLAMAKIESLRDGAAANRSSRPPMNSSVVPRLGSGAKAS